MQIRSPSHQVEQATFASNAATTAKTPHVFNGKVWLPLNDADANADNVFVTRAQVSDAPKAAAEAWTPGADIYWNATNGNFTTTSTGATKCGKALEAADAADTTTPIFLFDTFAA